MFEFEPDEYIFTKFAHYFKRRKKRKEAGNVNTVKLLDIKPRLTIFARAITGKSIEIYEAEREGGYKNNNFFLPGSFAVFYSVDENIAFYLFRVLYLSVQKNLRLNWEDDIEHETNFSREKARENSGKVLKVLFEQFPITQEYYDKFIQHYRSVAKDEQSVDYSFVYGKWMRNTLENSSEEKLKNFTDKVKTANNEKEKTILKAAAVEEIISVQIDQKQLDDAVLQHQFEKVETAEEFGGNW